MVRLFGQAEGRKVSRKRNPSVVAKEREWRERHAEYLAQGRAALAPQPDPKTHPKEFHKWMRDNARSEFTDEEKQIFAELKTLPKLKFRRARDETRWEIIRCLIQYQKRAGYDLMTCKLGKYPGPGTSRKGSKQVRELLRDPQGVQSARHHANGALRFDPRMAQTARGNVPTPAVAKGA